MFSFFVYTYLHHKNIEKRGTNSNGKSNNKVGALPGTRENTVICLQKIPTFLPKFVDTESIIKRRKIGSDFCQA